MIKRPAPVYGKLISASWVRQQLVCLILCLAGSFTRLHAQQFFFNTNKLSEASEALKPAIERFLNECLVQSDCRDCVQELVDATGQDPYHRYVAGLALHSVDAEASFRMHESAFQAVPGELSMVLQYGIALHRAERWAEAVLQYQTFLKNSERNDPQLHVWLSECYVNLDKSSEALAQWKLAGFNNNRVAIEEAIFMVHENCEQYIRRNELQARVDKKDAYAAYDLIYRDLFWKVDWWEERPIMSFFEEDMARIRRTWDADSEVIDHLDRYLRIREGAGTTYKTPRDTVRKLYAQERYMLNSGELFPHGGFNSKMMLTVLLHGIVTPEDMLAMQEEELLRLARKYKDPEFLHLLAYLEFTVFGKSDPNHLLIGWRELQNERLAQALLKDRMSTLAHDTTGLHQALIDFPESSRIFEFWYKIRSGQGISLRDDIMKLIRLEFRSLGNDLAMLAYQLNRYFEELEKY